MKIRPSNDSGFTVVEIVLAVALIAAIAGLGWFAWSRNSTPETKDAVGAPATEQTISVPSTVSTKYLTISELGIKLPLSSGISDLTYTYAGDVKDENGGTLDFSSAVIKSACPDDKYSTGVYSVYDSEQPNPGVGDSQAGTLEARINGHYIYYHHPQGKCGSGKDYTKVQAYIEPVLKAVQTAEMAK